MLQCKLLSPSERLKNGAFLPTSFVGSIKRSTVCLTTEFQVRANKELSGTHQRGSNFLALFRMTEAVKKSQHCGLWKHQRRVYEKKRMNDLIGVKTSLHHCRDQLKAHGAKDYSEYDLQTVETVRFGRREVMS